ncbi:MAG TPA: hypothetical protein VGO52_08840 [Hyphomonadaceae bacterium]|nr:hypothetical protein [Hyphomonadaceae bacterium]
MVPLIILGVATAGMLGLVGFGATRIFRQRRMHMADLPELPSPGDAPAQVASGKNGPTMQA